MNEQTNSAWEQLTPTSRRRFMTTAVRLGLGALAAPALAEALSACAPANAPRKLTWSRGDDLRTQEHEVYTGRVSAATLSTLSGELYAVAALLVLYQYDYRPLWLEQVNARWVLPSDRLAERGYALMSRGQTERAVETFRLAVVLDASSPYRWCDYGEALLAAGDRTGARKSIERLSPNHIHIAFTG